MKAADSPYSTHISILRRCAEWATGDILECGGGKYSTRLLHTFCGPNRLVVTLDDNPAYLDNDLASDWHRFELVKNWTEGFWIQRKWGLVFIDQNPPAARGAVLEALRGMATILVAHDTDEIDRYWPCPDAYGYGPVLGHFQYKWTCRTWMPWTSVLSETVNPASFLGEADKFTKPE